MWKRFILLIFMFRQRAGGLLDPPGDKGITRDHFCILPPPWILPAGMQPCIFPWPARTSGHSSSPALFQQHPSPAPPLLCQSWEEHTKKRPFTVWLWWLGTSCQSYRTLNNWDSLLAGYQSQGTAQTKTEIHPQSFLWKKKPVYLSWSFPAWGADFSGTATIYLQVLKCS